MAVGVADQRPSERALAWAKDRRWPLVIVAAVLSAVGFLVEPASYFLGDLYVRVWLRELGFAYAEFEYPAERLHTVFVSHSLSAIAPLSLVVFLIVSVVFISAGVFLIVVATAAWVAPNLFGMPPFAVAIRNRLRRKVLPTVQPPKKVVEAMDWVFSRGMVTILALALVVLLIFTPLEWVVSKAKHDAQTLMNRDFFEPAGPDGALVAQCAKTSRLPAHPTVVVVSCGSKECAVVGTGGVRLGVARDSLSVIESRRSVEGQRADQVCDISSIDLQASSAGHERPHSR